METRNIFGKKRLTNDVDSKHKVVMIKIPLQVRKNICTKHTKFSKLVKTLNYYELEHSFESALLYHKDNVNKHRYCGFINIQGFQF